MPAHINYETTPIIFYKFVCENPEIKSCCNNNKNKKYEIKIYKIIRDNGGWDQWKMIEINRQICKDKVDACKIEQQYIEELQSNMNTYYALRTRTPEQYYLDNKEQIIEQNKNYKLENKEKLAEKSNKKKDCECGQKYTHSNKSRHLKTIKHLKYCESIASK